MGIRNNLALVFREVKIIEIVNTFILVNLADFGRRHTVMLVFQNDVFIDASIRFELPQLLFIHFTG